MQLQFTKVKNLSEWNGDALVTALKDQSLRKISFKKSFVVEQIIFKGNIGRIRDIKIHKKQEKFT